MESRRPNDNLGERTMAERRARAKIYLAQWLSIKIIPHGLEDILAQMRARYSSVVTNGYDDTIYAKRNDTPSQTTYDPVRLRSIFEILNLNEGEMITEEKRKKIYQLTITQKTKLVGLFTARALMRRQHPVDINYILNFFKNAYSCIVGETKQPLPA